MEEIWKDVVDYKGHYMVSNLGRLKSLKFGREQIIKTTKNNYGYEQCRISKDGKSKLLSVHRLVAEAFIKNPLNKETVNHINGIKDDNNVENLEWATRKENINHAFNTGLKKGIIGEKNGTSKLTEENIKFIRENYKYRDKEFSGRVLAKKFNVTPMVISNVVNNKRWTHI